MNETWPPLGIDWYYADDWTCIACADCRDVLLKLPKVDLCLTDPPYGIGQKIFRTNKAKCAAARRTDYEDNLEWDSEAPSEWVFGYLRDISRWQIVWGGNFFCLPASRGWLVWDKLNGTNRFADAELAWTNLDMAVRVFRFQWNGMLRDGEPIIRQHPTQKPVELMKWCLSFVQESNVVFDPYCGVGTTLRAAKDLGRRCIGIEINEKYCAIAKERLRQEVLALK